jgi:hypothetical protein
MDTNNLIEIIENIYSQRIDDRCCANEAPEAKAEMDKAVAFIRELHQDASRYHWLIKTDPGAVCAIAWRIKDACEYDDPNQAIDAAIMKEGIKA